MTHGRPFDLGTQDGGCLEIGPVWGFRLRHFIRHLLYFIGDTPPKIISPRVSGRLGVSLAQKLPAEGPFLPHRDGFLDLPVHLGTRSGGLAVTPVETRFLVLHL